MARKAACAVVVVWVAVWSAACGDSAVDTSNATDPANYLSVAPGEEVVGPSIEENLCFLSKVVGGFNAESSSVRVYRDQARGKWVLSASGKGTQSGLSERAGMYCLNRVEIARSRLGRGDFGESFAKLEVEGGETDSVRLGPSDAFVPAVLGMQGEMRREGDGTKISYGLETNRVLEVSSTGSPRIGYGMLLWFSDRNPGGAYQSVGVSGNTYRKSVMPYGGSGENAVCFFEEIAGEFDSAEDAVWLDYDGGDWRLNLTSKCERRGGFLGLGSECAEGHEINVQVGCVPFRRDSYELSSAAR